MNVMKPHVYRDHPHSPGCPCVYAEAIGSMTCGWPKDARIHTAFEVARNAARAATRERSRADTSRQSH